MVKPTFSTWLAIWLGDVRVKLLFVFVGIGIAFSLLLLTAGPHRPVLIVRDGKTFWCSRYRGCIPITDKQRRDLLARYR